MGRNKVVIVDELIGEGRDIATIYVNSDRLETSGDEVKGTLRHYLMPEYDYLNTLLPYLILAGGSARAGVSESGNVVIKVSTDISKENFMHNLGRNLIKTYGAK